MFKLLKKRETKPVKAVVENPEAEVLDVMSASEIVDESVKPSAVPDEPKSGMCPDDDNDAVNTAENASGDISEDASGDADENAPENALGNAVEDTAVVEPAEDAASDNKVAAAEIVEGDDDAAGLEAAFEAWLEDNISDSGERQSAMATMADVIESLSEGGDRTALFDVVARGADYARAVEAAAAEGEVRGRNANIRERMELELDSDGVPHPGTGGNVYNAPIPGIFELARGASM